MNKRNYQKELDKVLEGLDCRPSLLIHSCCGPCSSYVLTYLARYFDITVLYYNPNIYPPEEYDKRKNEQERLIEALNRDLRMKDEESGTAVMPEGGPALEKGDWKLEVIFRDGTVLERTFSVSYGDVSKALASYAEGGKEGAVFDEDENLTVIGQ